jgi:uncharacterized membrane protein
VEDVQTTIQFGSPDIWVPILALLVLGAALWQFVALRRRVSWKLALLLTAIRTTLLASLLFFVLDPTLLSQRRERYRPTLAVAVDNSRSMGLRGDGGDSRLERVKAFLASPQFEELSADYYREHFVFSENTHPLRPEELETVEAAGRWTDLEGALGEIPARAPASLGAQLVFTDGGHGEPVRGDGEHSGGGQAPLLFIAVGAGEGMKDIEVSSVLSAGLAFAGRKTVFTVAARHRGLDGSTVPILMKEAGRVVLSRDITFAGEDEEITAAIEWTPPRPGRYHLSFEIPPQAGEPVKENNRVDLTVEASRDKIRVLLVSGRPSWSHRFLRDSLKGDPTLDLVSFIILRTASDAVNVPQDELSLIPFPTKKIFLEELKNFDLVIFENFSHRFYFPVQYLEKVRDYVKEGGGFWMLGGPLSFVGGGYGGTPIEEILPVVLKDVPAAGGYRAESFRPGLTAAAARHPFFQGLGELSAGELPLLEGYNVTGSEGRESIVLAEHVDASGRRQPIIVLGRYKEGRTMAVMTDYLWKWNFEMVGQGRGNLLYLSFIRQAIRWTIGDPQYQPVIVHLEESRITPGGKLRASIRVLGEDFLPARDPDLKVTLKDGSRDVRALPVRLESPGLFTVDAEIGETGTFEIEAAVGGQGAVYGRDSAALEVAWPTREFRNPGLNRDAMDEHSRRKGGVDIELGDHGLTAEKIGEALRELAPTYRVEFEEKRGLGSAWWAFALAFLLLASEWLIRKEKGLD